MCNCDGFSSKSLIILYLVILIGISELIKVSIRDKILSKRAFYSVLSFNFIPIKEPLCKTIYLLLIMYKNTDVFFL